MFKIGQLKISKLDVSVRVIMNCHSDPYLTRVRVEQSGVETMSKAFHGEPTLHAIYVAYTKSSAINII